MPSMGNLEPFDAETNWDKYREGVEQYFIANDVKEEKRRAVRRNQMLWSGDINVASQSSVSSEAVGSEPGNHL